ncbi:MAG: alpha/beta hydrolase-fold protein, partial [Cyclobacteriaceae bacterium]
DEFETREDRLDNPKGELYPDFLINEVMPLVNENFRTKQGAQHTALGGSSYGALIALFTFTHHPDVFGSLLLESPSLYVANQQVLKESEKITRWPDYVYLGIGTAEGETAEIQKMAVDDAAKLASNINRNSGATKLKYFVDEGGTHDFDFFAIRFPLALESLYSKGKSDF